MPRSSVVIVGRPNVGKSTLFNRLAGSRIAIEDPTSGVTRDRVLHPITVNDRTFDLIDTGGIGIVDRQDLSVDVEKQISAAIDEATLLIFLLDCRDGVTPLDEQIANRIRKLGKPVIVAANKADTDKIESDGMMEFFQLGFGELLPISAHQGRGIDELKLRILENIPEDDEEPVYSDDYLKIAFVGKRNAGKSSIINRLAGEDRVIVSSIPGTTRDSVDVMFEREDKGFVAIDTAGLRKRGKMDDAIEFFGQVRSERAVRRADVVVLMIDASVPLSKVDKRIGSMVAEEFKPCVIAINKWDLARQARPNIQAAEYHDYLLKILPGLHYAPMVVTSALTGENIWGVIDVAYELHAQAAKRVGTGQLNRVLQDALRQHRPPRHNGKNCKIYYGTQAETSPPTFIIFSNFADRVDETYKRYLAGQFRRELGFEEVPLKLEFRTSHETYAPGKRTKEEKKR